MSGNSANHSNSKTRRKQDHGKVLSRNRARSIEERVTYFGEDLLGLATSEVFEFYDNLLSNVDQTYHVCAQR